MSFHSQNSNLGLSMDAIQLLEFQMVRGRLYLSIATLSFPNKDNRYLGPCSDLN